MNMKTANRNNARATFVSEKEARTKAAQPVRTVKFAPQNGTVTRAVAKLAVSSVMQSKHK